jgi:argininosuccinate lyase
VIPGFTHSVQAQPTSLAHYLSAVLSSLERDEQRLRQAYARIDSSPLGAAAFTTSGFPLDRNRLRDLLGFSSLLENSYDAIMLSTVDSKAEFAAALAVSSLNIGRFAQQFLIQYSDSRPGLDLADSAVGHSSIMPQKRNPQVAERLRISASAVLGEAQTLLLTAHNTPAGEVADIRIPLLDRALTLSRDAASMLTFLSGLAAAIRVHPDRTLELVSDDYSVMTELADALYRHAAVPFRTGHKFASDLAAFGRARRLRPLDIPFADVDSVYRASTGSPCPLTPQQVRDALDPLHFVRSRQGLGGPQPAEVERMLTQHRERLASLRAWIDSENARLAAAGRRLDEAFSRLAGDSPL